MIINLNQEDEQIVREVAAEMATEKGISEDQALKDILAIGVNAWREIQAFQQRQAQREKEGFNPFEAARGEK